jgi:hypothetical protein
LSIENKVNVPQLVELQEPQVAAELLVEELELELEK